MVTFVNKGRCGNFLFQAATCIAYARQHGLAYSFPFHTDNPNWNPLYFPHLINPAYDRSLPQVHIDEVEHSYSEIRYSPSMQSSNIILNGYWQSYQYFESCRQDVLGAFGIYYQYEPGKVAIHVRRGDYLLYPKINPLATRDYYEKAVKQFWLKGYRKFLVFSDDIPWCTAEFQHPVYQGSDFEYVRGKGPLEDITRMSWCEHQIIANSTFSWWGAWLNRNPNKIVICPHEDNYYGPDNKHLDVSTLYPADWVRIKY